MKHRLSLQSNLFVVLCLSLFVVACAPLIGPYSPTAYKHATSLKAETLALMDKAVEPYSSHKEKVERLSVELRKAHEYVKGMPSNSISAEQWEILTDPEGALLGKFFKRWKNDQTMGNEFIKNFKFIVSDAFDEIICLEANKKKASRCRQSEGE